MNKRGAIDILGKCLTKSEIIAVFQLSLLRVRQDNVTGLYW